MKVKGTKLESESIFKMGGEVAANGGESKGDIGRQE